jgi:hypothetical protein
LSPVDERAPAETPGPFSRRVYAGELIGPQEAAGEADLRDRAIEMVRPVDPRAD